MELLVIGGLSVIFICIGIIFLVIRYKYHGKMVVYFIDKNKKFKAHIVGPKDKFFNTPKDQSKYVIDTDCVMYTEYPPGLGILSQTIPCLLYSRGNPQPLTPDRVNEPPRGLTSKMVESSVNENIAAGIVKGMAGAKKIPEVILYVILLLGFAGLAIYMYILSGKIDILAVR